MTTIDWLNERIDEGEGLLLRIRDLDAGPDLLDVRAVLMEFRAWEAENQTRLQSLLGGDSPWVAQYRGVAQVDHQLALTDFMPHKRRIEASLLGKLDELKSMREAVVRRVVPGRRGAPRVALGHGRSCAWRELEDFLVGELGLDCDGFEAVPTADAQAVERLDRLLDSCRFAALVVTAEDLADDASPDARACRAHALGLFEGRLGRSRVVLLLEEGCGELARLPGPAPVRFQGGDLRATFEALRAALVREGLIQGQSTAA